MGVPMSPGAAAKEAEPIRHTLPHREVLALRHLQARDLAAVTACVGRSVEAVKRLWARALSRLRCSLGGAS